MAEIEDTLRELDRWYNELPGGTHRPRLLSKLAVLELCGWLEHRLDMLVRAAGVAVGLDQAWIDSNVIDENHGFTYQKHLRRMLVKMIGEFATSHLEQTIEQASPGTLDRLKGELSELWKSRGILAHTHLAAPVQQQQVVNAPSWSINRQRILAKMLDQYEMTLTVAFRRTIAAP